MSSLHYLKRLVFDSAFTCMYDGFSHGKHEKSSGRSEDEIRVTLKSSISTSIYAVF